jgi:serine/threonine-protein kinase
MCCLIVLRGIEPGTVLQGTYEIVRRIGVGGMGEVYEARHTRLPGRFAVKVLSAAVESTGADFLRFRREAEVASSLRHPHIVQVVDFNQMADGAPYIVMEYLEGIDLGAEMAKLGRLSPERTAAIVGQIAAALSAAHAGAVVHRDLKPQNVLITKVREAGADFVKVVDFGISKVKTAATLTDDSKMLGTPQYMAPEQARARPDDVDGRTDQFALAVMAYEMLTGRKPFVGDSVPAILLAITNDQPASMPELPSASAAAIEAVIRRGMAKNRDDRYPTILEFADALASAIAGRQVELPVPGPTVKASGRAQQAVPSTSRRSLRALVAVAVGLLASGVVALKVLTNRSGRARADLPASTAVAPPSPEAPTSATAVRVSPDPPQAEAASASGQPPDAATAPPTARPMHTGLTRTQRPTRKAHSTTNQEVKKGEENASKAPPRAAGFIEDL